MKPDINIIISIDTIKKEEFIASLASFCTNTDTNTFNSNLITEKNDICFLINEEENTKWFREEYEFSQQIEGKLLVGVIDLTIIDHVENITSFDFWPVFSNGGQVCLDSNELKEQMIIALKNVNGYDIVLYEDGSYHKTIYEHRQLPA